MFKKKYGIKFTVNEHFKFLGILQNEVLQLLGSSCILNSRWIKNASLRKGFLTVSFLLLASNSRQKILWFKFRISSLSFGTDRRNKGKGHTQFRPILPYLFLDRLKEKNLVLLSR